MTDTLAIVDIVLPVFLVIALGCVLRAYGLIDEAVNAFLSKLVFYVAAPVLLFRSTALAPLRETVDLPALLVIAGVTVLVTGSVYLGCARSAPARRGVLTQGTHRSNMVFVGLPVVANAYGEGVLGSAAVLIGFMVVVYNVLAVFVLVLPHQRRSDRGAGLLNGWLGTLRTALVNPLILACAAGIAWSALDLGIPVSADRALEMVGRIALPLALLSVGASLEVGRLRAEIGPTVWVSALKLVVYPALVWAGLRALGLSGAELGVPILIMAAPTAVVSTIMAREMDGDELLAAAIVIGSTSASLVTLTGWLLFLQPV
jgi:predicted permease